MEKKISTFDIFCIASGVMISSGIFILPGIAFGKAGPAVFLSYMVAGIAALLGVLSIIELSTAMPKAGGDYFFITRSLGPLLGLIIGFFSWFSLSLKTAFAIFGISEILYLMTGFNQFIFAIAVTLFFVVINIKGVDLAVKLQVIIVVSLIIIILMYILTGLSSIEIEKFTDFAPRGINSIFLTAGFVFVSFGGLLKVASLSGEVKNPKKSIPMGVISSILVVTILYALLLIVMIGTSDANQLTMSLTPVADSAETFLGNIGFFIISVAAIFAFISTANAGIMSSSRYPVALSKDKLLPETLSKIHKKYKTPVVSIIITGIFIIGSLFLKLEMLVKIASSTVLFSYILTNIAVIVLHESKIQNYKPTFKVPLYPFIQILTIILFFFLLIDVGIEAFEIIIVIIISSLLIYIFFGRKKYDKEYALLYLIERIIDKKLCSDTLEGELKEILQKRDNIITDRFHNLIEDSIFLDLKGKMTKDELFKVIAENCCGDLDINPSELYHRLVEREKESSTALTPFLAIPHIIIKGEHIFKILVIRVKEGVFFSEKFDSVKAIFVLIGSSDERQFHLQALSSIAQITHNTYFEKQWLEAKSIRNLKDICLLSDRSRSV